MIGNSPDEEYVDPHGECAAEIKRLGETLKAQTHAALDLMQEKDATIERMTRLLRDHIRPDLVLTLEAVEKEQRWRVNSERRFQAIEHYQTLINRIDEVLG